MRCCGKKTKKFSLFVKKKIVVRVLGIHDQLMSCMDPGCFASTKHGREEGFHWLCRAHRKARGASLPLVVSEAELLLSLVFRFPSECDRSELIARVNYVSRVWHAEDRCLTVARDYGVRKSTKIVRGVRASDMLEMTTALVLFLCAHRRIAPRFVDVCVDRAREWYPSFAGTSAAQCAQDACDWSPRSERMLYAIEEATGSRDFLVLSDVARALGGILPWFIVRRVHSAYVAQLRPLRPQTWGSTPIR